MNLKWFSKNIKAVFAEEKKNKRATPKQQLVKEKSPVLITYFPWLAQHGPWSNNGSGDVSIKKRFVGILLVFCSLSSVGENHAIVSVNGDYFNKMQLYE